jgi:uncharacterized protein (TIGR03435 family)
MLAHLAEVAVRSTVLAAVVALVLLLLRSRRTAALEHAIWSSVVCGMLMLLAGSWALPRLPIRVPPAATSVLPVSSAGAVVMDLEPQQARARGLVADAHQATDWVEVVTWSYGAVALLLLARFTVGVWMVRRLLSAAQPIERGAWESAQITVPVTVGWLRPRVVLPIEWRAWPADKLNAVLTHEGAHARRRDGLVAAIAALNRCLFWFHPLAWVLERRLALLAEEACDEYSVATLGERDSYARLLLAMAATVDASHGRLRGHALTMAASSHIKCRVESLLRPGRTFSRGLTGAGRALVTACAVSMVFAAGALDLDQQQAPQTRPVADAMPVFDVVSIKPCAGTDTGGKSGRGGRGGSGGANATPGRLHVNCMTVRDMVQRAYVQFQDDAPVNSSFFDEHLIRGGPNWAYSERYSIEAATEDAIAKGPADGRLSPAAKRIMGPMFRQLLAERFRLQLRRAEEEVPIYAMTVAKSGFKLKPIEQGECRVLDPSQGLSMDDLNKPGQIPPCVNHVGIHGPNWTMDAAGSTMGRLAQGLGGMILGRPVVDKTGIAGEFSFHLEFARDELSPGPLPRDKPAPGAEADAPPGPTLFAELERKLGVRLVNEKGPKGYLIIDRVERPAAN